MRRTLLVTAAILVGLIASTASGWGREGHRISGAIAWHFLNEKSKAAVQDLLGEQSLAAASNWADEIRDDSKFDWAKPLHYINVPREAGAIDDHRDCAESKCVVGAIETYTAILRDANATKPERVQALKFLAHFVQDVHQPFHVAYADDKGGNSIKVKWQGRDTNLHSVWDTAMIEQRIGSGNWIALADRIRENLRESELKKWQEGSMEPVDWANESLTITRRLYLDMPKDGRFEELGHYHRNIGVIEERLAVAGVRLAMLLNSIFDAPEAALNETTPVPADDPLAFAKIELAESCGNANGKAVYLINTHGSKTIRVKLRKAWTAKGVPTTAEQTIVVRPSDRSRKHLGCSHHRASNGELREFEWSIMETSFVE